MNQPAPPNSEYGKIFKYNSTYHIHEKNYAKNIKKLKKKEDDQFRILKTIEWLKSHPVKCDRYSNKLDTIIQVPSSYTSYI